MRKQVVSFEQTESNGLGVALQLPAHLALSTEVVSCFEQGLAKLQVAEPAEAVELLTRAVELAPHFPEARICLGLAYALTYNIYRSTTSGFTPSAANRVATGVPGPATYRDPLVTAGGGAAKDGAR